MFVVWFVIEVLHWSVDNFFEWTSTYKRRPMSSLKLYLSSLLDCITEMDKEFWNVILSSEILKQDFMVQNVILNVIWNQHSYSRNVAKIFALLSVSTICLNDTLCRSVYLPIHDVWKALRLNFEDVSRQLSLWIVMTYTSGVY